MVDSVVVLDPAWQAPINPATKLPYDDVLIAFFDSGTTNAKTVYADADLSDSLGTVVSCNSSGFPTTSGNSKCLIYTDTQPYKIRGRFLLERES